MSFSFLNKKLLFLGFAALLLFFGPKPVFADSPFITTWQTTTPGETITIPTTGGGYNYDVDWGDSSSTTGITGDAVHVYDTAGTYTVSITGTFPRIYFNGAGDKDKIFSVEHWGSNHWTSMNSAFAGTSNLVINATDTPDLSSVTDMSYMFYSDFSFNSNLSGWDVSHVTNMTFLFGYDLNFNQPLNTWDVSHVTAMEGMFFGAFVFNQPLDAWNVSHVTNMNSLFSLNYNFNQSLATWNVSSSTDMTGMFSGDALFEGDVSNWNVSNVLNMSDMFTGVTLATSTYNAILSCWSLLPLQSSVTFNAGDFSQYSTSSAARQRIIDEHSWTIYDGGRVAPLVVNYLAGANGSVSGSSTQLVYEGEDALPVTAIPNSGYAFNGWDDALTDNPRTDVNISTNHTFTASFRLLPVVSREMVNSGGGGMAFAAGVGIPSISGMKWNWENTHRHDSKAVSSTVEVPTSLPARQDSVVTPSAVTSSAKFVFRRTLRVGMSGPDVRELQKVLNTHGFVIATTGSGSPGHETTYFGPGVVRSLTRFQEAHRAQILTPVGLSVGTGTFGIKTRLLMQQLLNE